jgi:hypothetical protein
VLPACAVSHVSCQVYSNADTHTEDELFAHTTASPAFWLFCDWLGERVRLKGHTGFRGDLDVKTDATGKYSYFARYEEHQVRLA